MRYKPPTRIEMLEYALEGAITRRGTLCPSDEDEEDYLDQLDQDIEVIEKRLAKAIEKEQKT